MIQICFSQKKLTTEYNALYVCSFVLYLLKFHAIAKIHRSYLIHISFIQFNYYKTIFILILNPRKWGGPGRPTRDCHTMRKIWIGEYSSTGIVQMNWRLSLRDHRRLTEQVHQVGLSW